MVIRAGRMAFSLTGDKLQCMIPFIDFIQMTYDRDNDRMHFEWNDYATGIFEELLGYAPVILTLERNNLLACSDFRINFRSEADLILLRLGAERFQEFV